MRLSKSIFTAALLSLVSTTGFATDHDLVHLHEGSTLRLTDSLSQPDEAHLHSLRWRLTEKSSEIQCDLYATRSVGADRDLMSVKTLSARELTMLMSSGGTTEIEAWSEESNSMGQRAIASATGNKAYSMELGFFHDSAASKDGLRVSRIECVSPTNSFKLSQIQWKGSAAIKLGAPLQIGSAN